VLWRDNLYVAGKSARQFAFGIAGLALITFAAGRLHLQPGSISLLYLIVVVFVSLGAGFVSSVAVSLVAVFRDYLLDNNLRIGHTTSSGGFK
jgi:K+-sensing histidine kinase KdpD